MFRKLFKDVLSRRTFTAREMLCVIIFFSVFVVTFIPTFLFLSERLEEENRREREARLREKRQRKDLDIRAEVQRRQLEKEKSEPSNASLEITGPADSLDGVPSTENAADVEWSPSGPHQGFQKQDTYAAAMAEEAAMKAAVRKRHEWNLQAKALDKELIAASKKIDALVRARLESGDAELKLMLDAFSLLSPEQLDYARREALKTLPPDKVDAFFNDLANHSSTKTAEQISQDAKDILRSREAYRIARREVDVEWEQIRQRIAEHDRQMPPDPFKRQQQ